MTDDMSCVLRSMIVVKISNVVASATLTGELQTSGVCAEQDTSTFTTTG